MAKRKWWAGLLGLASAACLVAGVTSLPTGVEEANADGATLITDFSTTEQTVTTYKIGGNDWSSKDHSTITLTGTYAGGGWDEFYPENTFYNYKTGVDSLTNVGEENGTYFKLGLCTPWTGGNAQIGFTLANGVESSEIAKLIVRAYIHLNSTADTNIEIASADGTTSYVYNTLGNEDQWVNIEIAGSSLANVVNSDTFSGFTLKVNNATGSGLYYKHSSYAAAPCYIMLDSISYETEAAATYNVTYNYGGKLANQTVAVNADPYKAVKPADPTVIGYDFGGWYTDEECTSAYNFDTVLTQDITLYAKWTEIDLGEGVIANFAGNDVSINYFQMGGNNWSADPFGTSIAAYTGAGFEDYFQDVTFLNYKKGVDSISGVGEENGTYLKVSHSPDKVGNGNAVVGFQLAKSFDASTISKITVRVYINLNSTETTTLEFVSADGASSYVYNTNGKDGQWVDIEIAGANLANVVNAAEFNAFTLKINGATGSGMNKALHNAWNNFDAQPCFIMLDSISYETEAAATYNVTYNYGGKFENKTVAVSVAPYKAENITPATVFGYDFGGWYTDEECTTAYNFDTVLTEDITLYAKWTEVVLGEGVLSDMGTTSAQFANVGVTLIDASGNPVSLQDVTNANLAATIASWGPANGTTFDVIDAAALAGSTDGKVMQINSLSPEYWGASNFGTKVLVANTVDAMTAASVTIRMYLSLDKSDYGSTKLYLYNFNGVDFVEVDTTTQYEWIDVTIKGNDLIKLCNNRGIFEGFIIRVFGNPTTTNNGNTSTFSSAYWPECASTIEPLFVAIDEVSFAEGDKFITYVIGDQSVRVPAVAGDGFELLAVEDKGFIGYTYNGKLYKAGDVIESEEDITVAVNYLTMAMEDGASIRIAETETEYGGIRFTVAVNAEELAALGENVTLTGVIIPTDKIDGAFDINEAGATTVALTNYVEKDGNNLYRIALVNVLYSNYNRAFSAIAYATVTYADGTTATFATAYNALENSRSIYQVAVEANASGKYAGSKVLAEYVGYTVNVQVTEGVVSAYAVEGTEALVKYTVSGTVEEGVATLTVTFTDLPARLISADGTPHVPVIVWVDGTPTRVAAYVSAYADCVATGTFAY